MVSLHHGLKLGRKGVISLVGAGGKTSLMFKLAKELSATGQPVLTTTTTKILRPTEKQSKNVILSGSPEIILEKAESILVHSSHVSAAKGISPQNKLIGLPPETIQSLWDAHLFRWIIIEADGAARRPLKAPASHEPVIPHCTHCVVGVLGLSALGKRLDKSSVFRPDLVAKISGLKYGAGIGKDTLCSLLTHRHGIFKGAPAAAQKIAFLNQADIAGLADAGHGILEILAGNLSTGLSRVIIGSAQSDPIVLEYRDIASACAHESFS